MSDTNTNIENQTYDRSPGPYASREVWEQFCLDNTNAASNNEDLRKNLRGLGAIDPATGLPIENSGQTEEEYQRSIQGTPPNPSYYPHGVLANPARFEAQNEVDSTFGNYSALTRVLRARDDSTVALLRGSCEMYAAKQAESAEPGAVNGDYRGFTVVSDTTEQAKMAYEVMKFSHDFLKTNSTTTPYRPMKTVADLPSKEVLDKLALDIKPEGLHRSPNVAVVVPAFTNSYALANFIKTNPAIAGAPLLVPGTRADRDIMTKAGLNVVNDRETLVPDAPKGEGSWKDWFAARRECIDSALNRAGRASVVYAPPTGKGRDELMADANKALLLGKLIQFGTVDNPGERNTTITAMSGNEASNFILRGREDQIIARNVKNISENNARSGDPVFLNAYKLAVTAGGRNYSKVDESEIRQGLQAILHTPEVSDLADLYTVANNPNGQSMLRSNGMPAKVLTRMKDGNLMSSAAKFARSQNISNTREGVSFVLGDEIGDNRGRVYYTTGDAAKTIENINTGIGIISEKGFDKRADQALRHSEAFEGNVEKPAIYLEGVNAPTNPEEVPNNAVLIARSGAGFITPMPDMKWNETSARKTAVTNLEDASYKITPLPKGLTGDKKGPNAGAIKLEKKDENGKYNLVTFVDNLPALDAKGDASQTRWKEANWSRARQMLSLHATKDYMTEQEKKSPELQNIRAVREAFKEKGSILYTEPATISGMHWNAERLEYNVSFADGKIKAPISDLSAIAPKLIVLQSGPSNDLAAALISRADVGKETPIVVTPPKNNGRNAEHFVGNAIVSNLPDLSYQQIGHKFGLKNVDNAIAIKKAFGSESTRAQNLDLKTGKVTTQESKQNEINIR